VNWNTPPGELELIRRRPLLWPLGNVDAGLGSKIPFKTPFPFATAPAGSDPDGSHAGLT
jgi:hypothetical protein